MLRTWVTSAEAQMMLGKLSQGRISQMVRDGILTAEKDPEGRLRIDRESVEHEARMRAMRAQTYADDGDDRAARRAEAQDRLRRSREAEAEEKARKEQRADNFRERTVIALEKIAACLARQ